jgi:hypothetical protein
MKRLSIAGVDLCFESVDPRGDSLLDDYAGEFAVGDRVPAAPSPLRISLTTTDDPIQPGKGGGEAVATRREKDVLFDRFDFEATWDPRSGRVEARCWGQRTSIGSLVRVLCSAALPREGGLLVHASSVVSRGRAFLFPGPSGAGKTTLASLGGARPVLCDEISAVRPVGDRYFAMPTPFFGEMPRRPRTEPAPLLLIGRPTKNPRAGDPPRLVPIGQAVALAELLHCAVAFDESPAGRREIVDAASALVLRIPAYDVHFSLERDPWGLFDELDLPTS